MPVLWPSEPTELAMMPVTPLASSITWSLDGPLLELATGMVDWCPRPMTDGFSVLTRTNVAVRFLRMLF